MSFLTYRQLNTVKRLVVTGRYIDCGRSRRVGMSRIGDAVRVGLKAAAVINEILRRTASCGKKQTIAAPERALTYTRQFRWLESASDLPPELWL